MGSAILWASPDNLAVTYGDTKPLVLTFDPVLPLTGFAAVENELAARARLQQQVSTINSADPAVGALSLGT